MEVVVGWWGALFAGSRLLGGVPALREFRITSNAPDFFEREGSAGGGGGSVGGRRAARSVSSFQARERDERRWRRRRAGNGTVFNLFSDMSTSMRVSSRPQKACSDTFSSRLPFRLS